jgi:NAD-dependent SIR2 family protein deacetylase
MTIDITILSRQIDPENTVLVLGAGASIPSGAPTSTELRDLLGNQFHITDYEQYNLADLATIIEGQKNRKPLISAIRERLEKLQPSGGLVSLPLFNWSGIFTTNYDNLIEKTYQKHNKNLSVFSSNYDFHGTGIKADQELFKIHGTIEKDVCDGNNSRLILTSTDYDQVAVYREALYSRLRDKMLSKSVLIIGHSLNDPDLRSMIDEAQRIKSSSGAPGKIFLFIYQKNEDLATVFQARGLTVCFGGIDELITALLKSTPERQLLLSVNNEILSVSPILMSSSLTVSTEMVNQTGRLERMFSGKPANFADILRGWTFDREITDEIEAQHINKDDKKISVVLGAAGVGKTTAVRKSLVRLTQRGCECWEHKNDFAFDAKEWAKVNDELVKRNSDGVLFVDDAHNFIRELNSLIEILASKESWSLHLVFTSSKANWNPRLKTAEIFKNCRDFELSRLTLSEINNLLDLLDVSKEIRKLVENDFLGFNRTQRLDRLKVRCDSDMFVCMKNIFGFQGIDTIILDEFKNLHGDLQSIYRITAGMQAIGASVHRELVRRLTGLEAQNVPNVLDGLDGIIEEYTVSTRDGIYGWQVRHDLIAEILAKYKYASQDDLYDLFDKVIENINPAYRFEAQSFNDICDLETGITRITDKQKQNILLRKMISKAPNLRVPRHRLIYNLINLSQFDIAESELRIFERELKIDGPVLRYKIRLKLGIAKYTENIQNEDRAALVSEASAMAQKCLDKYPDDKNMYRVFLEAGADWFRYTGKREVFEEAMQAAVSSQERLLDPELRTIISNYRRVGEKMGIYVFK